MVVRKKGRFFLPLWHYKNVMISYVKIHKLGVV